MFLRKCIALFCCFAMICGCTKVIPLDLRTAAPVTVIEGNITDGPGPSTVRITQTKAFYDDNSFTGVDGAAVTIRDGSGSSFVLTDEGGGVYATFGIQGVSGRTYFLNVAMGKDTFTAVSTMPER